MKKILVMTCAILAMICWAGYAGAQEDVQYKKKTVIDFDEQLMVGELKKPAGDYITERKSMKFDSLIRVRKNFEGEMFRSVDNLN